MKKEEIEILKKRFLIYKDLAEKAIEQIDDVQFFYSPDAEINSIALTVKHMNGNMRSRFTDFYSSDGEKQWRKRDAEFINENDNRIDLMKEWNSAWKIVFDLLNNMNESDTQKQIKIRGEALSVSDAFYRQLAHYSYHIGQIVLLAKWQKGSSFKSLSIPKGKSSDYKP